MENMEIQLSWTTDRIASMEHDVYSAMAIKSFSQIISIQSQQLRNGGWIFHINKYGSLCAAVNAVRLHKNVISKMLKLGFSALSSSDFFVSTCEQAYQLVLMDFWTEVGYSKAFLCQLRDQLKPQHESIVYFRIKNGKRIAKMLTRNDATTFMRRSQAARVDEGIPFLQTAAARDFYLPTYNTQMAFAQRVGEMALLMVHAPVAAASPLKPVLERIQTCARLEQHRVYASANGTPKGLVTWARLTSKRLRTDSFNTNALHAFEWSEGPHLAVVDVVMDAKTEAAVWADLAGLLYPDEDIWLLCKVADRTFFKKWAKHQRQDLLTNPQARAPIVWGHWRDITQEPSCVQ